MIKKILVSQPQPSSAKSPYYNIAEKHGVELVFRPFIKVEGIDAKEFRKQKVNILDHTAIVFTSRTAVDHFFRLVTELRITVPEDMKYFGISETALLPYRGIVLSLLPLRTVLPLCSSFRSHASCPVAVRPLVQPSVSLSARAAVAVPGGGAVHEMCSRSWNPLRNKRIIEVFPCLRRAV